MAAADAPTDARTWLNWALLERRRDHYGPARRSVKLLSHCHKCLASTIQLVYQGFAKQYDWTEQNLLSLIESSYLDTATTALPLQSSLSSRVLQSNNWNEQSMSTQTVCQSLLTHIDCL